MKKVLPPHKLPPFPDTLTAILVLTESHQRASQPSGGSRHRPRLLTRLETQRDRVRLDKRSAELQKSVGLFFLFSNKYVFPFDFGPHKTKFDSMKGRLNKKNSVIALPFQKKEKRNRLTGEICWTLFFRINMCSHSISVLSIIVNGSAP